MFFGVGIVVTCSDLMGCDGGIKSATFGNHSPRKKKSTLAPGHGFGLVLDWMSLLLLVIECVIPHCTVVVVVVVVVVCCSELLVELACLLL